MARTVPRLDDTLKAFIARQPMYFVATAAREGRVNLSSTGMDTLRIVSNTRVTWLNLTGSGNETAAHIRDVPRMTLGLLRFIARSWFATKIGLGPGEEAPEE